MSLSTDTPKTVWQGIHAYVGTMGAGDAMASSWDDLGIIDENALSITTQDGTQYNLLDINGELVDYLENEPVLTINFTLLKPSEATRGKFWTMEESGSGSNRKVQVKSLLPTSHMSIKFGSASIADAETFEAAKAFIKMAPAWEKAKGFNNPCTAKLIKGATKVLFQFGKTVVGSGGSQSA